MLRSLIAPAAFAVALTPAVVAGRQQRDNGQVLAACVQSQQQALLVVDAANRRIELARQTNQPSAMRAAMDDLQGALSAMRNQLAPCAEVRAAAPPSAAPGTANMPGTPNMPVDAGHVMPKAAAPAADSHAGHVTLDTQPSAAPAQSKSTTPPAAAASPHAAHVMPSPAAHASYAAVAATSPARTPAPSPTAQPVAVDPICGLKVNPADAPSATYQGYTYHFCSEQHRQSFLKQPEKFVSKEVR